MNGYVIPEYTTGAEIKAVRQSLGMTQKQFALFCSCSKPTVERWESQKEDKKITGPIVSLLEVLKRQKNLPVDFEIPHKSFKLRLYYMHNDTVCSIIDVDEFNRIIKLYNYMNQPMFRAFGNNINPSFEDYEEFLESRCFPRTRDKLKLELNRLGIPFYDPILIIEKTEGRMADDDFWVKIERV